MGGAPGALFRSNKYPLRASLQHAWLLVPAQTKDFSSLHSARGQRPLPAGARGVNPVMRSVFPAFYQEH